jgi:hypothetical protein
MSRRFVSEAGALAPVTVTNRKESTMLDRSARRSNRRVRSHAVASAARLDSALVSDARRFGHHGIANFIETARQRHSAAITETYARDVLSRGGYPNPKP